MSLGIVTRGYVVDARLSGTIIDDIVFLCPDSKNLKQQEQLLMVAVLNNPADDNIVVDLLSDQPSRVSVPLSVLIPIGEVWGEFFASAGDDLGPAIISATVIDTVQSTITVAPILPDLKPIADRAKELKPSPVKSQELKPRPISTEES